jgi:hypothetical protein
MSVDFGANAAFKISGSTYMTVTTAGRVLRPSQVCWHASTTINNPIGVLVFSEVTYNVGSGYNSTTGYFTAPVAGKYFVRYNQLLPSADAGEFHFQLLKNSTGYSGLAFRMIKTATAWWTFTAEGYMDLAVNDTAAAYYGYGPSNPALTNYNVHCSFTGHLIG